MCKGVYFVSSVTPHPVFKGVYLVFSVTPHPVCKRVYLVFSVTPHPVDISSVSSPRLSVDAIWEATSLTYDVTQLRSPVRRNSLKPLDV